MSDPSALLAASHARPVLLVFHATWCGPCRGYAPVVHAVAEQLAGRVDVHHIDIDQAPDATSAFRVNTVPTTVLLYRGAVVAARPGAMSQASLTSFLRTYLPGW